MVENLRDDVYLATIHSEPSQKQNKHNTDEINSGKNDEFCDSRKLDCTTLI